MYTWFFHSQKEAFLKKQLFDSLYEKYSGALFGALLNLTDNDEVLATDLLKKVFVEYFGRNNLNIQTNEPSFTDLLRTSIQVAKAQGYCAQTITSLLLPGSAILH